MSAASSDPSPAAGRVRRLALRSNPRPQRIADAFIWLVFGVGAVITARVYVAAGPESALIAFGITLALTFSAVGGWRYARRLSLDKPAGRQRRLASLCASPAAKIRCPHRILESGLRNGKPLRKAAREVARGFPGSVTILVDQEIPAEFASAIGSPLGFEPVELESAQAYTMLTDFVFADESFIDRLLGTTASPVKAGLLPAGLRRFLSSWSNLVLGMGFLLVVVGAGVIWMVSSVLDRKYGQLGMGASIFLLVLLASQLSREVWWLIPGGLVFERYRFWKRRSVLTRFDADSSTLVIGRSPDGELQMIVSDGVATHAVDMPFPPFLFLLAWLSTAPPPTDEQLLDFFAAGGETPELVRRRPGRQEAR